MTDPTPIGRPLRIDPNAKSAVPDQPAFVARPAGAPVYHGFTVIAGSERDGWVLGTITEPHSLEPQLSGDAFVVAPDGSRAGLVWSTEGAALEVISGLEAGRWGVYAIRFPFAVQSEADLIRNFHLVLPLLQQEFQRVRRSAPLITPPGGNPTGA